MRIVREWWVWFGWRRVVGALLATPLAVFAVWWLVQAPTPPIETRIPMATAVPTQRPDSSTDNATVAAPQIEFDLTEEVSTSFIAVHVVGAVVSPGVYHVPVASRADDAVRAAGGVLDTADLRRVNLAAMVVDGEQLVIPHVGERVAQPPTNIGTTGTAGSSPRGAPQTVDINRATASELEVLPGVGPATARAIVDHRAKNGPFATVDDLLAVRGIGPAKLAELRAFARV